MPKETLKIVFSVSSVHGNTISHSHVSVVLIPFRLCYSRKGSLREKKDGEGAIHSQDLLCCVRSRKLDAPNPLWTFRCVLRSCIPLIPRAPLSPTWPYGTRERSGQIYIAAFFDPTASALVGTLGQIGRGVPGACQAGAGEEATHWRAHLSRGPFLCHNPNTHLDGNLKDCCFTPSQILASRNSQC